MLPLEPDTLRDHQASTVYLVTYAQTDLKKVGSRKAFADIVTGAFNQNKLFNCVEYWCCAKERQREGGRHYDLALKLTDVYRWKQVKESITKNHGMVVNFQDFKTRYYDAYRYTTKKDPAHIISDNHPANIEAPRTALAIATRAGTNTKSMEPGSTRPKQQRRLQSHDIYAVIVENNIKSDLKLCAHAEKLKEKESNPLLFNYVFNKDEKRRNSTIQTAWKMKNATATLEHQNKNRMTILEEVRNGSCTDDCAERWLLHAKNTLQLNGLDPNEFAAAIRNLIEKGRSKHRNIILVGNSNYGKTFLLKPLTKMMETKMMESRWNVLVFRH